MLTYAKLKRNRRKCVALTGVTPKEFTALLPAFARAYAVQYPPEKTMTGKPRKRQAGSGRKGVLQETEQQLLFILVHQKTYPLQTLLGEVFELSQPRVNEWVHRLLPILKVALDELGVLPERDPAHFAQSERQYGERPEPELIIDGTERRRQRPKNAAQQADAYSGKKKTHCDKNVVLVQAKTKRVGFLSQTYLSIPRERSSIRTPAFRGTNRLSPRPISRKKAPARRTHQSGEADEPQNLPRPSPGRTCARGGQAIPEREGGVTQHEGGRRRFAHAHCLRIT
jgi:hypothetical protein